MKIFEGNNIGKQISEHFTNFKDVTLLAKKPIANWPEKFGQLAAETINQEGLTGRVKVLVAHGGVGRTTLEVLRNCQDLAIDHTDSTANRLQVLEQLLEQGRVQWYQQLEGNLVGLCEHHLPAGETKEQLLTERGNSLSYWQADYKNLRPQLDGYQFLIVDFRHKDSALDLLDLTSKLQPGGLLLLSSIDEVCWTQS